MTNQEWKEMFGKIPTTQHNQVVITLTNGTDLVVDVFFRFEPTFMVIRGRQGGSVDESRAFFVPYDQLLYFRLERNVKLPELYQLFGEEVPDGLVSVLDLPEQKSDDTPTRKSNTRGESVTSSNDSISNLTSDGPVVKNNLLERIRAARVNAASKTRQQTKDPK
jgi:hypothetical protein